MFSGQPLENNGHLVLFFIDFTLRLSKGGGGGGSGEEEEGKR
jgi:hypothetical protein